MEEDFVLDEPHRKHYGERRISYSKGSPSHHAGLQRQ